MYAGSTRAPRFLLVERVVPAFAKAAAGTAQRAERRCPRTDVKRAGHSPSSGRNAVRPSAPGGRAPPRATGRRSHLPFWIGTGQRTAPETAGKSRPRSVEARISESAGRAGLGGAARAKPELSTPPDSGALHWRRIWRRSEGVRLPGCFGENNPRLRRSTQSARITEDLFFSLLRMAAIRFCLRRRDQRFGQLTHPRPTGRWLRGSAAGLCAIHQMRLDRTATR